MSEDNTESIQESQELSSPSRAKKPSLVGRFFRRTLRLGLLMLGPLAIVIVGGYYYLTSGRFVSTENAYIKSDHILISTDVDGRVAEIHVKDHQFVSKGTVLFRVDQQPFEIAVNSAEAELANIAYEIEAYRASYRQAQAELARMHKDTAHLKREYARRKVLAEQNIIARSEAEKFRFDWQSAQGTIRPLQEKMSRALSNLGGTSDMKTTAHPRYQQGLTELAEAKLKLAQTVIRAPADGVVSNVELQKGEYVDAGRAVFSLLSIYPVWVKANLKETQLTHVEVGQRATLRVDAYPDYEFHAHVASLGPGTGAEFSILPAQNATGNWVKVVQRIPVKLDIDLDDKAPRLRAGMSVVVKIDTEYKRSLPSVLQNALAWIGYQKIDTQGG